MPRQLAEKQWRHDARVLGSLSLAPKLLREFLLSLVGFWVAAPLCRTVGFWDAAPSFVPPLPGGRRPLTHSPRREVVSGPAHTRGAHPAASGRLKTVVLFRQSYPALTNGGVDNAVVPCGTGALVTQSTLRTLRQLSNNLGLWLVPDGSASAEVLRHDGLKTFSPSWTKVV